MLLDCVLCKVICSPRDMLNSLYVIYLSNVGSSLCALYDLCHVMLASEDIPFNDSWWNTEYQRPLTMPTDVSSNA
ncbi:hypothetical protein AcW1_009468 [Taiwanofungus camphoratus]|nr:hypothetical protein AcV5_002619 [Antrodia cinnamomea]KAI0918816.1 hypothetical protein AcV7_006942 [Antrodia cinnamomea]KAI0947801.1 hypothetical protein AcW1_009468 [Antrodia cinnamomea]